jgi:hypothetical protein
VTVLRVLAVMAGVVVAATVLSALRTVVLPRATPVWLSRQVFVLIRKLFDLRVRMLGTYEARDRLMALYGPLALAALPAVWLALVLAGFTVAYWGLGVDSWRAAFAISGSAITMDRGEFDDLCGQVVAAGVPLRGDLDQAWRDFAGWRVNYDQVLVTLAGFTMAPYAPWSSDRSVRFRVPALQGAARLRGESPRRRRSGGSGPAR